MSLHNERINWVTKWATSTSMCIHSNPAKTLGFQTTKISLGESLNEQRVDWILCEIHIINISIKILFPA